MPPTARTQFVEKSTNTIFPLCRSEVSLSLLYIRDSPKVKRNLPCQLAAFLRLRLLILRQRPDVEPDGLVGIKNYAYRFYSVAR